MILLFWWLPWGSLTGNHLCHLWMILQSTKKKQKNLIVMFSELSYTVVQTSILCLSNDAIYANLYLPLMNGGLILFFLYTLADSWGGCAQIYHGAGKNPPLLWCFLFAAWTIFVLALGSLRVQRFLGLSTLSRSLNLQSWSQHWAAENVVQLRIA